MMRDDWKVIRAMAKSPAYDVKMRAMWLSAPLLRFDVSAKLDQLQAMRVANSAFLREERMPGSDALPLCFEQAIVRLQDVFGPDGKTESAYQLWALCCTPQSIRQTHTQYEVPDALVFVFCLVFYEGKSKHEDRIYPPFMACVAQGKNPGDKPTFFCSLEELTERYDAQTQSALKTFCEQCTTLASFEKAPTTPGKMRDKKMEELFEIKMRLGALLTTQLMLTLETIYENAELLLRSAGRDPATSRERKTAERVPWLRDNLPSVSLAPRPPPRPGDPSAEQGLRGPLEAPRHAPRPHNRRGHWRTYKSGRRTFVNEMWVGPADCAIGGRTYGNVVTQPPAEEGERPLTTAEVIARASRRPKSF